MSVNFFYDFVKKNHITKRQFISYFIALALTLYFLGLMFFGERGLQKLISLQREISKKELTKQELIDSLKTKKAMVEGMNSQSLDLDLLDEQARKVLGYVGNDEVVVYHKESQKKDQEANSESQK